MTSGMDPFARDMLEYRGELLGQVADLFDDLESVLARSRNRFFNTWNEAAFHHRSDDGPAPAIPMAAASSLADEVDARHTGSGGNGSVTSKIDLKIASSARPASYTRKSLEDCIYPIPSLTCSTPVLQCNSLRFQQVSDDVTFEIQPHIRDSLASEPKLREEGNVTNHIRRQTTRELMDDLYIRTKLVGQFSINDAPPRLSNTSSATPRPAKPAKKLTLKDYVTSWNFELASTLVIIMNAIVMAFEVQYKSFDDGYAIGYLGQNMRSAEVWPRAKQAFYVLEFIFGLIFTIELLLKLSALRCQFHRTPWNLIDVLVVACWFLTLVHDSYMPFNPTLLRLLRITKLIRLAKMFKSIEVFDSLQVLVGSIRACCSALVWSSFLLLLIQTLFAFVFNTLLHSFIIDENYPEADRLDIYELFGSFSRAYMSMTELTIGNWVPICRALYEKVAQVYGYMVLVYVILVNFAIVRVITGVFLQTTFQVAAMDDDLMVIQKIRTAANHRQKMMRLLTETDVENKGYIEREDFRYALRNSKLKQWLSAMDLEVNDADLVFDFLDDGDGKLDYDELIQGVSRLKGAARSIDVVLINRRTLQLGFLCKKIIKRLDRLTYERESCPSTIN